MPLPSQPKNSIAFRLRLDGETLPERTVPLNLFTAAVQAEIFNANAAQIAAEEFNAEILAAFPKTEVSR